MDRHDDPWAQTLTHFAPDPSTGPTEPTAHVERRVLITPLRLAIACVVGVIVLTVAIGSSILAYVNDDRADRWQERSIALQSLVSERTRALNSATQRLNTSAVKLKRSQTALARSESDVDDLEERQTELANEKAQLADERALLKQATSLLQSCNSGLTDVLAAVADGQDPSLTLDLDGISRTCQSASTAVPSSGG